ncbi:hypothetical protein T459_14599 [Capsicum annuum]|uniref:GAG-pre-integrase domain-containing protein n=1 Tax=Capsicum annuum TaxID=4072 RepID=A0A2G2ZI20_CAPAN|nr:hypothetical protein T459_14599 [Capsicum annuum]
MGEHHGDRVTITVDNSTYLVAKEKVMTIEVADNKSKSIKLQDVYHVPGLKKNLVYVPQITNSGKYELFGPIDVKVLENVKEISANIIFTGERKGSLLFMSTGEAYVKKTSQTDSAVIWHAWLGHVDYQMLQQISSRKSSNQRNVLFELVHTDLMGPTITPSYSIYRCVMVLVDDYSRFTWVKVLKEKSEAYLNTPQQNRGMERKLCYLTLVCLSWLHDKNLPRELWAEAIQCGCHVTNRLPHCLGTQKSPFELLYSQKPNMNYFWVFGSTCYVHVPITNRTKLDPKERKCIFVGYDSYRKDWRCMDPKTNRFTISRDMVFDETSSLFSSQNLVVLGDDQDNMELLFPKVNVLSPYSEEGESVSPNQNILEVVSPSQNISREGNGEQQAARRSTRDKKQPNYLKYYEVKLKIYSMTSCFFTGALTKEEPLSYKEAKGCPHWERAMQEDIGTLDKNETWELVPKPEKCNAFTYK